MQESLQKLLRQYNVKLSESTVSMVLGAVVVLVVGLLAYNYFKANQPASNVTPAEVSTEAPATNESGEVNGARAAVALPTTHVVAAGENLWTISEKYFTSGYNYVDIAAVNGLKNANKLAVGQKLSIPKVMVRMPLGTGGPALYPVITDSRIEGASYTVLKGDNLWSIAVRAYGDGFKWVEVAKVNNLTNPNLIHAGNVLSIPR